MLLLLGKKSGTESFKDFWHENEIFSGGFRLQWILQLFFREWLRKDTVYSSNTVK